MQNSLESKLLAGSSRNLDQCSAHRRDYEQEMEETTALSGAIVGCPSCSKSKEKLRPRLEKVQSRSTRIGVVPAWKQTTVELRCSGLCGGQIFAILSSVAWGGGTLQFKQALPLDHLPSGPDRTDPDPDMLKPGSAPADQAG